MPVEEGLITFYDPQTGTGAQATIGRGGNYRVETEDGGLLVGTYCIFILPPLVTEAGEGRSPPVQILKDVPNIPVKYRHELTSGLEVNIHEGENTCNVEMHD